MEEEEREERKEGRMDVISISRGERKGDTSFSLLYYRMSVCLSIHGPESADVYWVVLAGNGVSRSFNERKKKKRK